MLGFNHNDEWKIEKVEIDKDGLGYFIHIIYKVENEKGIYLIDTPKLALPIRNTPSIREEFSNLCCTNRCIFDLGFGELYARRGNGHDRLYTITELEKKTHEMTIEEIEKKLGYKVKIVAEK